MKELSIEEKAKAYDNALSIAQETYTTQPMYREWLAKMFPELAESGDERIRKALIKYFTLSDDNADYQWCGVHYKDTRQIDELIHLITENKFRKK